MNYKLELHVENWVDGSSMKSLPIEFIRNDNNISHRVALKKTDADGNIILTLPKGVYLCRVESELGWTGGTEVELTENVTTTLKVLSVLR